MTAPTLFISTILLTTTASAACRSVGSDDGDPFGDHDASTDTNADTDTDTYTDGLTRVYGTFFGGSGYCCGQSSSTNPSHIVLTRLADDCESTSSPAEYDEEFDAGGSYEIILEEGGCYDVWANDTSYMYCYSNLDGPLIVGDGESYYYDIHLSCCCDED